MADNVTLATMSGGDTCAADDIGGVKWQRMKVGIGADGSATDWSATNPAPVQPVTGTAGGWSVSSHTALTSTDAAVKSSAGQMGGWYVFNPNTSTAYVQVFNATTANVTVGTTTPAYVLGIPAGSAANCEFTCGIEHGTAITVAATTTTTGSTAPTTALVAAFFYK